MKTISVWVLALLVSLSIGYVMAGGVASPFPFIYNHGFNMVAWPISNATDIQSHGFSYIPTPGTTPTPGATRAVTFLNTAATPGAEIATIRGGIVISITP